MERQAFRPSRKGGWESRQRTDGEQAAQWAGSPLPGWTRPHAAALGTHRRVWRLSTDGEGGHLPFSQIEGNENFSSETEEIINVP